MPLRSAISCTAPGGGVKGVRPVKGRGPAMAMLLLALICLGLSGVRKLWQTVRCLSDHDEFQPAPTTPARKESPKPAGLNSRSSEASWAACASTGSTARAGHLQPTRHAGSQRAQRPLQGCAGRLLRKVMGKAETGG